jgi:molybdate transport system ATP-binding protein
MSNRPLISLENITLRIRDTRYLADTSWRIGEGENWAVLGPNGSGKSTLVRALFGRTPIVKGKALYHFLPNGESLARDVFDHIGYVSPELYLKTIKREERRQVSRDFAAKEWEFTPVKEIVLDGLQKEGANNGRNAPLLLQVSGRVGIEHILERPISSVSSGEIARVMLARALIKSPRVLILDEPFNGLDGDASRGLSKLLDDLMGKGMTTILVTHRTKEILPRITHMLCLHKGKILYQGKRDLAAAHPIGRAGDPEAGFGHGCSSGAAEACLSDVAETAAPSFQRNRKAHETLIRMNDIIVRYDHMTALEGFSWTVKRGENWLISGPNGAGKTTILNLIYGDNLQAYANDVEILGRKRGSGGTLRDLRKSVGSVSPSVQARYRVSTRALNVVCSGFHDSLGLYRSCTTTQMARAEYWIRRLGAQPLVDRNFEQLSFGERQLILIARAMVEDPTLLLLDEPCDGLDEKSRETLLKVIGDIGCRGSTSLIYVTHHEDEVPRCITHRLRLDRGRAVECGPVVGKQIRIPRGRGTKSKTRNKPQ